VSGRQGATSRHDQDSSLSDAVVAVAALALGITLSPAGDAVAAVKSVLLGTKNKATSTTTISNSRGTALALNSPSGKAPLAVNSTGKVVNLNADRLDGLDSSAFARAGGQTGYIVAPLTTSPCARTGPSSPAAAASPSMRAQLGAAVRLHPGAPAELVAGDRARRHRGLLLCGLLQPEGRGPGAMSAKAVRKLLAKAPALARASR
jgi:hypothetical protein